MKKAVSILIVVLMLSSMVGSANAVGGGAAIVSSASGAPGETVSVAVSITSNPGVMFISITPSYDSDKLELVSLSALSGWTVATSANWDGANDESFTGEVVTMTFKIKEDAAPGSASASVSIWAGNHDEEEVEFTVTPGAVTIASAEPEAAATISGLGAYLADAMDLKIYVTGVAESETPRFRVTQPDRPSNPVLTQAASDAEYALSNVAVYTVNWDSAHSRWIIRIKVFPKFISSSFNVELLDGDGTAQPLKGYSYQGVGSNAIATSHGYSFLDYVTIMKIYKSDDARYTELYNVMSAYDALMKSW